ncbi:hypothetical protein OH491_24480 [Termitidicoccus mucosus]|uniref:Uncharacterized protein n=1 Tax=Termitidicoccus mucosus TaxID=1184151 RepID=A0A178IQS0_9BACT|nr:hypothetical protein AW736_02010 [Opitutaceae bacterium TSB47]
MKKLSLIIFFIISIACFADVDNMWLPSVVEKTYKDGEKPTVIRFQTRISKDAPQIYTVFSLQHMGTVWEADDTLLKEVSFYPDAHTYIASSPREKERVWIQVQIRTLKPPKEKTTESSLVMEFLGASLVRVSIEHRNDNAKDDEALSWPERINGSLKKKEPNQSQSQLAWTPVRKCERACLRAAHL